MSATNFKTDTASDGRKRHHSVGIVLDYNGKYFLLDRKFEPYGWAGPAGHIDVGEEPEEALIREVCEEIGVDLVTFEKVCEEEVLWCYCGNPSDNAQVHYWYLYRARAASQEIKLDRHEAKKGGWFTAAELSNLTLEPVWKHWFTKLGILRA